MSRYIDADAAIYRLTKMADFDNQPRAFKRCIKALDCFADQESADVKEVKYGKWIDSFGRRVPFISIDRRCPAESACCSICGDWLTASDEYTCVGNYCPNCGAIMDLEDNK